MDYCFSCNGLGTNPHELQSELGAATGMQFIPLIWQRKIHKTKISQRTTDFFDERDYTREILDPLIEKVNNIVDDDSNIFFVSYSTGSIITEDIISGLNSKKINHLLIAPAIDGSGLADALEKGILLGKLFVVPIGLLAVIQTRKMIKKKGKIWLREILVKGTRIRKGINRTLIFAGKENVVKDITVDFEKFNRYCWGEFNHQTIGKFDKSSLGQRFNEISVDNPARKISKKEILGDFLKTKGMTESGLFL
ncbi:MAG: hypothetical protein INQ03_10740 [Candidatus Heimdallarchaeota archaeon]|nr:hypothetical protein [Candidatus Heimdallarchaeota archaeon]